MTDPDGREVDWMDGGHIERVRRFDELFRAHIRDVSAYCGWRTNSPADAQDAVAEVFLTAWRRLDELPDGDAARLWLYATARRVIANQRRASRRHLALRDRLALERSHHSVEVFSTRSRDGIVREALRRLRPRDREVLLLAEWENLTPGEIAAVVGCLTVTARGRLHRARFRFRVAFEELQAERDPDASIEKEDDHVEVKRIPGAQASQPAL
jgi:RNA polymerase sigma-70 factor, ECF subfamily